MQLILGLSPHHNPDAFADRMRAACWAVAGADANEADATAADAEVPADVSCSAGRTVLVALLSPSSATLPALLDDNPGTRAVIAYHSLEDELALGIASGMSIAAASEAAKSFVERVLATFRYNRKRVTLVKVGASPGGLAALAREVDADIPEDAVALADPVLRLLVRQWLATDPSSADLPDLHAELEACSVRADQEDEEELSAGLAVSAIEEWNGRARQAETALEALRFSAREERERLEAEAAEERSLLRDQLSNVQQTLEERLAALARKDAESEEVEQRAREEIALLREQLQASQQALAQNATTHAKNEAERQKAELRAREEIALLREELQASQQALGEAHNSMSTMERALQEAQALSKRNLKEADERLTEEIGLLRDQLRASQEALEELAITMDELGAGVSRRPILGTNRLSESVDLTLVMQ